MPGLAGAAAEAYLSGWALTDGPFIGQRAQAGCVAAVACALDHPHDPRILEATLELGKLEGTWALVYDRRERLLRKHLKAITVAWDACMADLDPRDVAHRFRRDAYIPAEAVTKDPKKKWWQQTALSAALGWLYGIYHADGFGALIVAIEDALRDGMAEGEADALALAANRQGKTGFRIADAFDVALAALAADHLVTQQAHQLAASMINGAASDTAARLAKLAGDGAGEDDMAAGAEDVTTGDGARSARSWADWALFAGIGAGALGLYRKVAAALGNLLDNAVLIDWITAGGNVCPICQDNERGSPYTPGQLPAYPGHIRCRCSTQARTRFPLSFLTPFLD